MAQKKLLRDGIYSCPLCNNLYEIKNADSEKGDGYCEDCKDDEGYPVALTYEAEGPPPNSK